MRGLYLGETEATAWAEWYRHTSELGAPPTSRLPRDTWRISVAIIDVADFCAAGVLADHGITELRPTRLQWPVTQPVGEAYYRDGYRGLLAPSAAREGGLVLAIYRPLPALPGLTPMPPPNQYADLPPLPTGLRT